MLSVNLLIFLAACIVLALSGRWLVKLLVNISKFLNLRGFIVASVIMAFSTSIPELFVGINSALLKTPIISLGNVIGSNIVDITLVIGIAALLARGKLKYKDSKTNIDLLFILAALPLILMGFGNELSRLDGFVLIAVFGLYTYSLIKKGGSNKELKNNKEPVMG